MEEEYNSLLENQIWDVVPLPSGRKLVRCKWVYRTKSVADGKITRRKARLVANGFQQVHGIDYDETFALVAKMESICLALAIVFSREVHLEDGGDTPLVDSTLYRQLVGSLLYLTHSRPDLSYEVGAVSRYMQEPHELHWNAAKLILRYVQGTITFGIHYVAGNALNLLRFTDSDWVGGSIDHTSTSGYSLSLGSSPICWSNKK
eukprot:PITA_19475